MIKVILLTLVTISRASDLDKIIGETIPVAVKPAPENEWPPCAELILIKTDAKCTCKDRKDLPMVLITRHSLNYTIDLIPLIAKNEEEEKSGLEIKSRDCSCGEGRYPIVRVFRVIDDNYYLSYVSMNQEESIRVAVLCRKNRDSREKFDEALEAVDFKKGYKSLCDDFTD